MTTRTGTVLDGFGVPESLRWHENALWFCDLAHGTVHRWAGEGEAETVVSVPGRAGGLGWLPDGRMLVVSMDDRCVYRQEPDGSLVEHADLRSIAGGPVNDMLVDDLGRAYVGNFGFDYHAFVRRHPNSLLYAPPGPTGAPLACFDPDGALLGLTEPLLFPNGAVLIGDTFVVAETLGLRLTAFTVGADGLLADPTPWAPLIGPRMWQALTNPGLLGKVTRTASTVLDRPAIAERSSTPIAPDGIALGADGTIWVANALRGECVRVARGGEVLDRVPTTQHTLSCLAVGDKLYAATVPDDDPVRAAGINGGRIEVYPLP
ncbi:MAG: hypothetical protein JWQ81_2605 [Amycolatopsis sp.]|jgi:sugar lactone lactonase YvrE|uniref:SMP-30/gluconolactonase/LRE family protein n=1 Tax=Amycolatopsis sp. TaxID=37632 RepID=UPI002607F453|nr:SMP-30/gluconolactonase/LRE family protein [Amycolatopsis sp.]MCU1681866.1 hypothetical protein [Amycolatopsis sp.]